MTGSTAGTPAHLDLRGDPPPLNRDKAPELVIGWRAVAVVALVGEGALDGPCPCRCTPLRKHAEENRSSDSSPSARTKHLVGEVVGAFEDDQPRHQPRRPRRLTGAVRVDLPERLLDKRPVQLSRQRHQRMAHADVLIPPRAQQIALVRCRALSRPHRSPSPQITSALRESRIEFWSKNPARTITFRQLTASAQN